MHHQRSTAALSPLPARRPATFEAYLWSRATVRALARENRALKARLRDVRPARA